MSAFCRSEKIAELEELLAADPLVQVEFPLAVGDRLSSIHAYSLLSTLKLQESWLGECPTVLINSIAGVLLHNKQIETHCNSQLQLRVPISKASRLYALAGKRLSVGQGSIALQPPTIRPLICKKNLRSRIVTIKLRDYEGSNPPTDLFLAAANRKLQGLGIQGEPSLALRRGEPQRRVIKIKGKFITGYAVEVKGLSEEDSLKLQQFGLGGRKTMGGGWFE